MIDYQQEARALWREVLREDWMDEKDLDELITALLKGGHIDYAKTARDLEVGVRNGHSIEQQKALAKALVKLA